MPFPSLCSGAVRAPVGGCSLWSLMVSFSTKALVLFHGGIPCGGGITSGQRQPWSWQASVVSYSVLSLRW